MKVIGLSVGRRNGNCEILLREALWAVEESEIETELVRAQGLGIKPCRGCERCSLSMSTGGDGFCAIEDDYSALLEKIVAADGLIISAPVFHLQPPGLLKTIADRMMSYLVREQAALAARQRIAALISVGGGDKRWVSFGLTLMKTLPLWMNYKIVDQMQVGYASRPGHVLLFDDAIRRAAKLGRNVGGAVKTPIAEVKFMGEEAVCPCCHSDLLQIGTRQPVRCPMCGITGILSLDGEKITVEWDPRQVVKPIWSVSGLTEHYMEIMERHAEFERNRELVRQRYGKYKR